MKTLQIKERLSSRYYDGYELASYDVLLATARTFQIPDAKPN